MIDLHCHILPEVDDGPTSLHEALALAEFCVRDGITHITATPHCNPAWPYFRPDILPRVAQLNDELTKAHIPLTVLPGSEIQLRDVAEYRHNFESGRFCHLGDSRSFTLLEFSWNAQHYPPGTQAVELIAWLRERDMTPLIAHPERHPFLRDNPARMQGLAAAGAWFQITVDSLLGNHGPEAETASAEMVRTYPDVILATDAHNLRRCSGLSAGYAWVRERFGAQKTEDLRRRSDRILSQILAELPSGQT